MSNGKAPDSDQKHNKLNDALEGSACEPSAQPEGEPREVANAARQVDSSAQPPQTAEISEITSEGETIARIDTGEDLSQPDEVRRLDEVPLTTTATDHLADTASHAVSVVAEADEHAMAQEGSDTTLDPQKGQDTEDATAAVAAEDSMSPSASQSALPNVQEEVVTAQQGPAPTTTQQEEKASSDAVARELVLHSVEADATHRQHEAAEAARILAELGLWVDRQRILANVVPRLLETFSRVLTEYSTREQAFPPEALAALASRKQGIELCAKMLERLANRIMSEAIPGIPAHVDLLPPLETDEASSLLLSTASETCKDRMPAMLKERRIHNHKAIADIRDLAEASQKRLLTTVERQLLPIIDGLHEGKKICGAVREELCARFPDHRVEFEAWLAIYDELIDALLAELVTLDIQTITTSRGDPVDYELHEPIDVEQDSELTDEHVKEVIRQGYVMLNADRSTQRILRPGQVIVVKNPHEE